MAQSREELLAKKRARYHANKAHIRGVHRAWARKNRARLKNSNLKSSFGITLDEYHALKERQNGGCAICGKPEWIKKSIGHGIRDLAVDHCHTTGKVRGLLCARCNRGLGLLGDDPALLMAAFNYLSKSKVEGN